MPARCHCPLIGVCLPLPALRKALGRRVDIPPHCDAYSLHVHAVGECRSRSPLSEALQRELDSRYANALRRFAAAKTTDAVLDLWQQAVESGDIAAALWAGFSHPRCDEAATERIYRDVHMIQHQAGAAVRLDTERTRQRLARGDAAERELAELQDRHRRLHEQKSIEIEQLQAQLLRIRAELIGRDSLLAAVRSELAELQSSTPDLAQRKELTRRVAELTERNRELAQQLAERNWERESDAADLEEAPAPDPSDGEPVATADFGDKAVLCVGGRENVIAVYRDIVERHGGRFVHHDGGVKHTVRQLDAALGAAEVVICQTGCISHNAYWLVKNHCKRTGKRCLYLDRPSAAGLARGLAETA